MAETRDVKSVIGVDPGERKLITWALVNDQGAALRVQQYPPPPEVGTYARVTRGDRALEPDDEPELFHAMIKAARLQYGIIAREIAGCADRWSALVMVDYHPPFPSGWWSIEEIFQTMAKKGLGYDTSELEEQKKSWSHSVFPFLPLQFFLDDLTMRARRVGLPDPVVIPAPYSSLTCGRCQTRDRTFRDGADFRCYLCGYEADADANAAHNLGVLGWGLLREKDHKAD